MKITKLHQIGLTFFFGKRSILILWPFFRSCSNLLCKSNRRYFFKLRPTWFVFTIINLLLSYCFYKYLPANILDVNLNECPSVVNKAGRSHALPVLNNIKVHPLRRVLHRCTYKHTRSRTSQNQQSQR